MVARNLEWIKFCRGWKELEHQALKMIDKIVLNLEGFIIYRQSRQKFEVKVIKRLT